MTDGLRVEPPVSDAPIVHGVAAAPTVICVLGMHRSGTSLITRALNLLGVDLGPEAHRMKPREDNPLGFSEHQLLSDLSEEILVRLGGGWHTPPTFPAGWEAASAMDDLRTRASQLVGEDFGAAQVWGWKDPRTCLTLPFWQQLLPPMRYVVCVRSPLDVARSLKLRDGFSKERSVGLWLSHMRGAMVHTSGSPRLFVSYDDFIEHQEVEVARLAAFVSGRATISSDSVRAVRASIDAALRHHATGIGDVARDPTLSFGAKAVYVSMRQLVELQRREPAIAEEFAAAVAICSDHAVQPQPADQDVLLLRDQLVDLKWVAHHAVAEAERVARAFAVQSEELAEARGIANRLQRELQDVTLRAQSMEQERDTLLQAHHKADGE